MYESVVLIDLKDKGIVDIIPTEYLDSKACSEENETNNGCEVVCVQPGIYFLPLIVTFSRTYT